MSEYGAKRKKEDESRGFEMRNRRRQAEILYLIGLSVFLAPTQKMARGFLEIEDVPKDVIEPSTEIYRALFKDDVDLKLDQQQQWFDRMDRLFPRTQENASILRPSMPREIRTTQVEVQQDVARFSQDIGIHGWKVLNPGDARTCSKCREWIGRTVSDNDNTYDEWMRSGALHNHCRCSLHPLREYGDVRQKADDYLRRKTERIRELIRFNATVNRGR